MIVPSMNSEELTKEIFLDYPMVIKKGMHLMEGLRRTAAKSKNKNYQQIIEHTSSRKNNWLVLVKYVGKVPNFFILVYYLNDYGINVIIVARDQSTMQHYTSHFFDRYNSRFLKLENLSKLDLIKRFIAENSIGVIENYNYLNVDDQRFFCRLTEGIGLGYTERINYIHKIYHFKTFISKEMIKGSQQHSFNLAGEYYKIFWNEVNKQPKKI